MSEQSSILKDLKEALGEVDIPVETGVFSKKAPDEYMVVIPMTELFLLYADNFPQTEIQEVRISLFSKHNYMHRKNEIVRVLINNCFTITNRSYQGFEEDTGFHHFAIDVAKEYEINI